MKARYLGAYAACLVLLGALDAIWLGVAAAGFYQAGIGHLMAASPRLDAVLAFYLMYPVGILVFAVRPARNAAQAAGWGAALGCFAYATYDLTNLATLRDWPVLVSVVDIAWGTVLGAALGWAGFLVARRIGQASSS